jgi:hypothetical protein
MTKVSVYVLRKNLEEFPKGSSCNSGDVVILPSGDILAWSGFTWVLLPGRYLDINQLKEFVGYVSSGWPTDIDTLVKDLSKLIPDKRFLGKALEVCNLIIAGRGADQVSDSI